MNLRSNDYPLDFIEAKLVVGAVIQLGRPWRFVPRDGLCVFNRATISEIGGYSRGSKIVAASRS